AAIRHRDDRVVVRDDQLGAPVRGGDAAGGRGQAVRTLQDPERFDIELELGVRRNERDLHRRIPATTLSPILPLRTSSVQDLIGLQEVTPDGRWHRCHIPRPYSVSLLDSQRKGKGRWR